MSTTTKQSSPASKRGPGRPRRFDADAILDSALELFWKRGYDSTTTRELEDTLGVSQSSLYNEFGSKQALLELALDRYEQMTSRSVLNELENSTQGLAAIDRFFERLARWVTVDGRRGCMLINMMAEDGAHNESITQRTRNYRKRVQSALTLGLKRAVVNEEIEDGHLNDKANLLLGLVLGFNIAARGGASKSELKALLQAVRSQLAAWRV